MNILKINGQALEGIYVDAAISFNKPAKRVSTYSVPGRNGDLVIDEGTFDNVLITYPVFEKSTFPTKFDEIVNYLASLEGYQRIECSNDPQHYRLGRFVVPQNPTAKRLNRDGYWQLSFDCKPQRWFLSGEEDTEIDANPIDEYSGDIVSFEAVALDEITELKAAIEPVQNLNGQTSPWPAGGGKNKVQLDSTYNLTKSGVTVEVTADDEIWVHGTPTFTTGYISFSDVGAVDLSVVGQLVSASITSKVIGIGINTGSINGALNFPMSSSFVKVESQTYLSGGSNKLTVNVNNDAGTVNFKCKIQIELGSSATAWTPYSNICPITGWSAAEVVRSGENMLTTDQAKWGQYGTSASGYQANAARFAPYNQTIPFEVGKTYTIGVYNGMGANKTFYVGVGEYNPSNTRIVDHGWQAVPYTFTVNSNTTAIRVAFRDSAYANCADYVAAIGTKLFVTMTEEAAATYPISLGQTVYGGTLNVTTGVLTIDRAMVDLGTLTWTYSSQYNRFAATSTNNPTLNAKPTATNYDVGNILCDRYATTYSNKTAETAGNYMIAVGSGGGINVRDENYSDAAAFKTAMSGVQLVYELATPTTVQLTPTEVTTLLGQNNIWADCGDVEVKVTTPTVFNNPSLFNSKPLIRVYGVGTFRVNDITVTIASHDKPYIDIDCELQECYYGSENMNEYVSFSGNDFPELQPGDNYMLLASGITKLDVTPRWWVL